MAETLEYTCGPVGLLMKVVRSGVHISLDSHSASVKLLVPPRLINEWANAFEMVAITLRLWAQPPAPKEPSA